MKFSIQISVFLFISYSSLFSQDIAKWQNGSISLKEFEHNILLYVFYNDNEQAAISSIEKRRKHLRGMIIKELIMLLTEDMKIDTIKTLKEGVNRRLYALSKEKLFTDSIKNKVISEENVRKAYLSKKYIYNPSHILLTVNNNEKTVEDKINIIYQDLLNDKIIFFDSAQKYSNDTSTANFGGDLGWVSSKDIIPIFSKQLAKMKDGEICKPFLTEYGWHIIYLKDKKFAENLKPYELERKDIIKELLNSNLNSYKYAYNKFKKHLFSIYNVNIDTVSIRSFKKQFQLTKLENPINNNSLFIQSDIGNYSVSMFINKLKTLPESERIVSTSSIDNIIKITTDHLFLLSLRKATEELGYVSDPVLQKEAKQNMVFDYYEYILNNFVNTKLPKLTFDEILYYYINHLDDFKSKNTILPIYSVSHRIVYSINIPIKEILENNFEEYLLKKYNVFIDDILLENTFFGISDTKK